MTYNKVHRFLLRSVASRGVMSMAETEEVLKSFCGDDGSSEYSVKDLVKAINDEVRPFQFTIKITTDEFTNEEALVFLSLGYDEATKAQGIFSANELEFFRVLIEQIMTTESRQITGIHAINLVGSMKTSFTKTEAQKLLDLWCRMRYLDKDQNNYALGLRAIHEFEGYLRQNMPDTIEECCLCKAIVFRGYNCPACGIAVHTRCLNRYLDNMEKWPCCKADYSSSQLEKLNCQSSRLTQSQWLTTQHSEHDTTVAEPTVVEDSEEIEITQEIIPEISQRHSENDATVAEPTVVEDSEEIEITQEIIPEISQRVSRKRKFQK